MQAFNQLYENILSITNNLNKVKIGLEATVYYSYNILGYFLIKFLLSLLAICYI